MPLQRRNPAKKSLDQSDMLEINSIGFALGRTVGMCLALPRLRGFWPMSVVTSTGQVNDLSTNGLHLTNNNTVTFSQQTLIPYVLFNGTNQYLSRATEANLEITTALTLSTWVQFDNASSAIEVVCGKKGAAGQYGYFIQRTAGGALQAVVSSNGTTQTTISSSVTIAADTWYFVSLIYNPSISLSIKVNSTTDVNTTLIPASLHNSTAPFTIGASGVPGEYLDGFVSFTTLSAYNYGTGTLFNLFEQSRLNFFGVS